jgi:hypothetical protein
MAKIINLEEYRRKKDKKEKPTKPKEISKSQTIIKESSKNLKDTLTLNVQDIEIFETKNEIFFYLRFHIEGPKSSNAEKQIFKLLDDFHQKYKLLGKTILNSQNIKIISNFKKFLIEIKLPKNSSEEQINVVKTILEELKENLKKFTI